MPDNLQISSLLLWELVSRCDERSGGFRVRGRVVTFTPIDVCFTVGLLVVGERVIVDENEECNTLTLFEGVEVTVDGIVDMLRVFEDDVANFCRLYILLAFGELYFPRSGTGIYWCY